MVNSIKTADSINQGIFQGHAEKIMARKTAPLILSTTDHFQSAHCVSALVMKA
jgi:hypothetical protein